LKIGEKLFEMLDALVKDIGEENVVQVITDNVVIMSLLVNIGSKKT